MGLSSATIRNEMAALEKLGFLEQMHTSSGRVPTTEGYRWYVDQIMSEKSLLPKEKASIDEEFIKPENMTNSAKLNELTAKQNDINAKLDNLYQQWEEISSI